MANRKKSSSGAKAAIAKDDVADAVEEIQAPTTDEKLDDPKAEEPVEEVVGDQPEGAEDGSVEAESDTELDEPTNLDEDAGKDAEAEADAEPETEPFAPESAPDEVEKPGAATETIVQRRGGFLPMVLGGAVAAALGYGVAAYTGAGVSTQEPGVNSAFEQEIRDGLAAHSQAIGDLTSQLSAAADGSDLSGIESAQSDLGAEVQSLSGRIGQAESQLATFDERLTAVEKRPISEGASDAAVAAYERELRTLQEAMATQRSEIEAMTAEARAMEANAEETAQATMRRAALTRIQTALEKGTPFASALADLESAGVSAPAVLAGMAADGVPSRAALEESYPEAARAALAISRKVTAGEDTSSGIGSFLKTQLGVRSLNPQEGDDPDAVLSRAEAALRDGRLGDALAEIEALPEEGRTELSDWAGAVTQRLDAIAAAQTLAKTVN